MSQNNRQKLKSSSAFLIKHKFDVSQKTDTIARKARKTLNNAISKTCLHLNCRSHPDTSHHRIQEVQENRLNKSALFALILHHNLQSNCSMMPSYSTKDKSTTLAKHISTFATPSENNKACVAVSFRAFKLQKFWLVHHLSTTQIFVVLIFRRS